MKTSAKILFGSVAATFATAVLFIGFGKLLDGVAYYIIFFGVEGLFLLTAVYLATQMNQAYWKVAKSKDTLFVERRDGFYEMTDADYYTGWLKSKFGYHLLTTKSKEITTGKNIAIALDMFGPTVRAEDVAAVEAFAKEYKIQSAEEMDAVLDKWCKCAKCGWQGIPKPRTEERETEVGGIKEKETVVVGKTCQGMLKGKQCEGKDDDLKEKTPEVLVPFYKTVSLDNVKFLMKSMMNPSKAFTLVDRLARIKMGFDNKLLEFLGKCIGYGMVGMFVLIGAGLFMKFAGLS